MESVKKTGLHANHIRRHATMTEYAGWDMPVEYKGLAAEHEAVRQRAGLFDVSHMGEITVKGPDAEKFVDSLVTNDVTKMSDLQTMYALLTNERGTVVDDLLIYRNGPQDYLLVVNAANVDKDFAWITEHKGDFDVKIENESDKVSQIALQGPKSEQILQKIVKDDLSELKPFRFKTDMDVNGVKALVSRTGYTGEDGFEIYLPNEDLEKIWDTLMEVGKEEGVEPIGLGARDTLRFEAHLPLYGNEISDEITPLEAGYGMFVKLDKASDFIGKEALKKQKEEGLKRKIVGLEMIGKGIARHGYEVYKDGEKIGFVTTGYASPTLGKNIAMALIDKEHSALDTVVQVKVRNRQIDAKVVKPGFYSRKK